MTTVMTRVQMQDRLNRWSRWKQSRWRTLPARDEGEGIAHGERRRRWVWWGPLAARAPANAGGGSDVRWWRLGWRQVRVAALAFGKDKDGGR